MKMQSSSEDEWTIKEWRVPSEPRVIYIKPEDVPVCLVKRILGGNLRKIAEYNKLKPEYLEEHENSEDYGKWSIREIVEAFEEKFKDLDLQYGLDNYYHKVCIGMTYDQMKDSETKKDFEKRIADRLKEMTGKDSIEIECLVDGGMEG